MADDKLKQELFYMVSLTSKYDFTRMEVVEGILRLENERRILDSVFGRRFKTRIFDIAAGVTIDDKCVLCGQHADNHVICEHCMNTVLESDYAKSKIKNKQKRLKFIPHFDLSKIKIPKLSVPKFTFSEAKFPGLKRCFQYGVILCLSCILVFQIYLIYTVYSLSKLNPMEEATVSSNPRKQVSSVEEALSQLELDFPKEQGYNITYAREDVDYVGRFLLEPGACCEETEEQLTDEERYDYYFTEPVYIFYISYNEKDSGKVGVAEVNEAGAILVMGAFNNGRRTDSYYKYR